MALKYHTIAVTSLMQNASIVWCDETMKAIIVDPGGDEDLLFKAIVELKLQVEKIVLTHGHLDHVGGSQNLAQKLMISQGQKVVIIGSHKADDFWFESLEMQSQMFNFNNIASFTPDAWLSDGDTIYIGNQKLEVIHAPGHTPGHIVLYSASERLAFVGDVLFNGGVGRTDFPQGDFNMLIYSIKTKLLPLGDDVVFISGHGASSSFGHERKTNPFLLEDFPAY